MNTSQELHRKAFELTLALYRVTDFFPQGEALKRQLREKANEIFGNVTEYDYAGSHEAEALSVLARVETIKGYLRVSRAMRLVRPINLTILEREYEALEHFFRQELAVNNISQNRDWNPDAAGYNQVSESREKPISRGRANAEYTEYNQVSESHGKQHASPDRTNAEYTGHNQKATRQSGPEMSMPNRRIDSDGPAKDSEKQVSQKPLLRHSGQNASITGRQKDILSFVEKVSQAKISDFQTLLADVSAKTIQRDLHDLVQKDVLKKEGEKRWTIYSLK
ncbi:MAG: hypothetical protein HY617_01185 [Candidatus Sungbacteria bacterium]|nr:hypothetical protein [Candidatus Sungbacteria bacterium]